MKSRDTAIAFAFRNVDTKDVAWLIALLGDGGHGQFWKAVMREVDSALRTVGERLLTTKEET